MGSRVALVMPLRSSLGLSGSHDGLTVADLRHPDAVETTLARMHDFGDLPIVTCASADTEEVRRLLTFTAVRNPGFRACLEPLAGTPMAVGVVSSLVDDLNSDETDSLAWQLSALDHLRDRIWSAVWLPKVSGLAHPSPTLRQHARSWFRGSGFLAVHRPQPVVLPAHRAPVAGLDRRPDDAIIHSPLVRSTSTWVVEAVAAALAPRSVSAVESVREQIDVFGTADAVELVSVPLAFHSDSRPDPASVCSCQACGARHTRSICPVCRMSPESRMSAATTTGGPRTERQGAPL